MQSCAMFDFIRPELPETIAPLGELIKNLRDGAGHQDMPGIAEIHHTLRHIDATANDIHLFLDIPVTANRTHVDAHAQFDIWMS